MAVTENKENHHLRAHVLLYAWLQLIWSGMVIIGLSSWYLFLAIYFRGAPPKFDFLSDGASNGTSPLHSTPAPNAFPFHLVLALLVIAAIPGLVSAIGLHNRRPWARKLAIVSSILDILQLFPIPLFIGIYGLVHLSRDDSFRTVT